MNGERNQVGEYYLHDIPFSWLIADTFLLGSHRVYLYGSCEKRS